MGLAVKISIYPYIPGVARAAAFGREAAHAPTSHQPITRLISCIGQTIPSSLFYILVSNALVPQLNVYGPADFDPHTLDAHNISNSQANMFDFRCEGTKTSAATAICSWDINIHCVFRLAWQTDKFIFMSIVTEQIKARLKSILPQRLCSFCFSNSVEMARTGERTLRISKCQVWAVLTRAKCHGSLLTLGVESFATYPQSLISVLMPQRPRSDSGLKRLNEM